MGGSQWGGSEALWHAVAMYALERGDEVFVSVYDWNNVHTKIEQLQQVGAQIRFRKRYNPAAGTREKISRFFKQRIPSTNIDYQAVIDFKPSIVFISQGDSFDLAIHHLPLYDLLLKNKIAYSFVCHSHAQYGFIPPKEIYPGAEDVFKNAKNIFFVSKRQHKLTERRLITTLENAKFTWNPFSFKLPEAPLEWPNNNIVQMALVGNLDDMKGQDTVFEVLSAAEWQTRDWHLNIYGKGAGLNYLKALAAFYRITGKINFNGYVAKIEEAWKQNHLLLIPSAGEGMPISLVEAMVCGRPSVVTDVGGNIELIIENESGFISASPTVESFAAALEKAWLNKSEWEQIGSRAFEMITSKIDLQPHIKIYELLK